jgi:hypothetical protein
MLIAATISSPCSSFFSVKKSILALVDSNAIVKWIKFSQMDNSIPANSNYQVVQPTFFRVDVSQSPDPPGTTFVTYILAIATTTNVPGIV